MLHFLRVGRYQEEQAEQNFLSEAVNIRENLMNLLVEWYYDLFESRSYHTDMML